MPRITLTDFVDIVGASGTHKATKVRDKLHRDDYHPAKDFYKKLREKIIEVHRSNGSKKEISDILISLTDKNKVNIFPTLASSYISWWGRKRMVWFDPPHHTIVNGQLHISINPELGLEINGTPHLIKLYFKKDKLSKNKSDIITQLMDMYLSDLCPTGSIMSLLDIPRKKLFVPTVKLEMLDVTVKAELAYITSFL